MHVVVVGAGIAGLTTALALRKENISVTIIEQARELREQGAGIQLTSNGIKVLRQFGLEQPIAAVSAQPSHVDYLDLDTGETLLRRPLGEEAAERYGAPCYQIHRGDLLNILVNAVPDGVIRYGARLARADQDGDRVVVRTESGETLDADALVGADGIHSSLREQLFGEQETRFASFLSWRALIPAERLNALDLGKGGYVWAGPGRSVIAYWVRPGELYNFVGTVPADEIRRESWHDAGDVGELLESFRGAEPRLMHIVRQVEQPFITGLYYRDPVDQWTMGRMTLIGDAAHAMLPFLAQGACQGIEDAQVLAKCLARHGAGGVSEALREYERRRRPRTTRVQSAARSAVRQLHEHDAEKIRARNGQWVGINQLDPVNESAWGWLYRYDAVQESVEPIENVQGLAAVFEGIKLQRDVAQRAYDLRKNAFKPEDVARGVDGLRDGYRRFLLDNFPLPAGKTATPERTDTVEGFWLAADQPGRTVVLHFHGGGYVIGSAEASTEYAARLADAAGGRCFTVEYALAPEHPYPAALDDAFAAYLYLLDQGVAPEDIVLSGESSGGGLAVALALRLRDDGIALPAGIVAISPFVDLTLAGPSIDACAGRDPTATRDGLTVMSGSYFQKENPRTPLISPLFADLRGLPPMLLQTGSNEGLASDTSRLEEAARDAGVDVTAHFYDDTVHVFALYPFLPEARDALERIGQFVHRVAGEDNGRVPQAPVQAGSGA